MFNLFIITDGQILKRMLLTNIIKITVKETNVVYIYIYIGWILYTKGTFSAISSILYSKFLDV